MHFGVKSKYDSWLGGYIAKLGWFKAWFIFQNVIYSSFWWNANFLNQKAVDFRLSDKLLHYPQIAPFSYFTELCCACASWEFIFQRLIFHKAQTFKKVGLSIGIEVENGIFFWQKQTSFFKNNLPTYLHVPWCYKSISIDFLFNFHPSNHYF